MSTAARPRLAPITISPTAWAPWAVCAADVLALEVAFLLGQGVRRFLGNWLTAGIGPTQYLGIAAALLLLPLIHYQIGLYPGYLLGPVEKLRRRTLATLAVFGGLVAWDLIVARGVVSRGVLLSTLLFALVLPPVGESVIRRALVRRARWGIPVVILGAGDTGRLLARMLAEDPQLGLYPVAFLDNRPDAWHSSVEGISVAGPLALARDFESRAEAAILVLADLRKEDR